MVTHYCRRSLDRAALFFQLDQWTCRRHYGWGYKEESDTGTYATCTLLFSLGSSVDMDYRFGPFITCILDANE